MPLAEALGGSIRVGGAGRGGAVAPEGADETEGGDGGEVGGGDGEEAEGDDDEVEEAPAAGEEGPEPVRGHVDQQLRGEEGREDVLHGLEEGVGAAALRGGGVELQLGLGDVDCEADQDEGADEKLGHPGVVEAAEEAARPVEEAGAGGEVANLGGVGGGRERVDPSLAVIAGLGVEVVGSSAVMAALDSPNLDDVEVVVLHLLIEQSSQVGACLVSRVNVRLPARDSWHICSLFYIQDFV